MPDFMQVATVEAIAQGVDLQAMTSPEKFMEALGQLEASSIYTPDRAVLDLQTIWNVASEVPFFY